MMGTTFDFDWKRHGTASLEREGWTDGAVRPAKHGIFEVIYQDGKRSKAYYDGSIFFTPNGDSRRVWAWRASTTAPAHEMTDREHFPLSADGTVPYESKTADAEALQMMAERALAKEGLDIVISLSKVTANATGAISAQRVLAMNESEYAVFDGSKDIKVIAQQSLDRRLDFGQSYTLSFKDGAGTVFDGIKYTVVVNDPGMRAGGARALTIEEREFIQKQILTRVQFMSQAEIHAQGAAGAQSPLNLAISQALKTAQAKFDWVAPRPVASVLVEDELATLAFHAVEAQRAELEEDETEGERL